MDVMHDHVSVLFKLDQKSLMKVRNCGRKTAIGMMDVINRLRHEVEHPPKPFPTEDIINVLIEQVGLTPNSPMVEAFRKGLVRKFRNTLIAS